MSPLSFIFTGLFVFISFKQFAQDYFSYGGGNYSGLNQVIANPAAVADNRLKLDVILGGADLTFNNSWFGFKREALHVTGKIKDPANMKFPDTWQNLTPGVPDNVYKNFVFLKPIPEHAVLFESRALLPSAMYQIDNKNAVAFTWSMRQISNIDGISRQFAHLFEHELDLSVTQNNKIQNKNLSMIHMAWAEYGLTYGRVLKDKHQHFLKAGITPKLLQGLESVYMIVRDLSFLFSTKDTLSYFNTNFSYGHSANIGSPGNKPVRGFYHYVARPKLGLDLGVVYEWRPKYQTYKHKAPVKYILPKQIRDRFRIRDRFATKDGKHHAWRDDLNKYKLKIGASIVDIGKIKFEKQGVYYDLNVSVRRSNFIKYQTAKNSHEVDSLIRNEFAFEQKKNFSINLPTALNLQIDYSIVEQFYVNLSSHLTYFSRSNLYKVHNYSAICLAPRFEHYWYEVSVPLTYNVLSAKRGEYIMPGLNLRGGPVSFGTNDLIPLFKGNIVSLNFYVILRANIPYKRITDQDGDGVIDKKDECPDDAGDPALNGCPDKDKDQVPDKLDKCPNQPGVPAHNGCPE
jgi:hypothetical protein